MRQEFYTTYFEESSNVSEYVFLCGQTYRQRDGNCKPNYRMSWIWYADRNALQIYRRSVKFLVFLQTTKPI